MIKKNKMILKNKSPLAITGYIIAVVATLFSLITLYGQYVQIPEEESSGEASLLFVQTAHSGTLSDPQADNKRTLTLIDVAPTTVYFSYSPDRITGHEETQQFIEEWNNGADSFSINPPNAALDIMDDDSQSIIVLELLNPVYDANAGTLQYDVIILGDQLNYSIPKSFGEAALFIDSTYKNYYCGCIPDPALKIPGEINSCTCEAGSYNLGKSKTKELRGYCNAAHNIVPLGIDISGKKKGTYCNTEWCYENEYCSRSCTNWNPSVKDRVYITIECYKDKNV